MIADDEDDSGDDNNFLRVRVGFSVRVPKGLALRFRVKVRVRVRVRVRVES